MGVGGAKSSPKNSSNWHLNSHLAGPTQNINMYEQGVTTKLGELTLEEYNLLKDTFKEWVFCLNQIVVRNENLKKYAVL
jgi:hypothetical protein